VDPASVGAEDDLGVHAAVIVRADGGDRLVMYSGSGCRR
jgi:hypothetical protein